MLQDQDVVQHQSELPCIDDITLRNGAFPAAPSSDDDGHMN